MRVYLRPVRVSPLLCLVSMLAFSDVCRRLWFILQESLDGRYFAGAVEVVTSLMHWG